MTITALIDGDWILYAAGFAGQRTKHVYLDETHKRVLYGGCLTEIKAQLPDDAFRPDWAYKRTELDEERNFYHTAKLMIERNLAKIEEKFGERNVIPKLYIDGDGNFRSRLATIRPYKGTRAVDSKPLMYNNLRSYLLDVWDAEVVFDQEADDAMAIAQTRLKADGEKSIIVSVDKDMLQVPGWHLNPNKGFKNVSAREGLERQYVQCIQGDPVDNIGGAYKFGPKKSREVITSKMTERELWDATVLAYKFTVAKYGDVYRGLLAEEAALENMRLVYLRRHVGDMWTPPE